MSNFAILAIAWIPVAVAIVIGVGFFLGWMDDRASGLNVFGPMACWAFYGSLVAVN